MTFLPRIIQRTVVVALLAVWFFPAVSAARPLAPSPAQAPISATTSQPLTATAATSGGSAADQAQYAEREKQAQGLEQFQGGAYIYIGGGAVLVLLIILLILLV